jgi:hypothetical protein
MTQHPDGDHLHQREKLPMFFMGRPPRAFEAFVCFFTLRKSRYLTSGGLVYTISR